MGAKTTEEDVKEKEQLQLYSLISRFGKRSSGLTTKFYAFDIIRSFCLNFHRRWELRSPDD